MNMYGLRADEIIIDNFAGGGGASLGIEQALGRSVDIAINHDEEAVAMHAANHPTTRHYCEDVWQVDPIEATAGRPVGLAWFSPDCKHFSKAKGGKPVDKKIRGLAWVVIKWAATVRPRVIMLENVEEFQQWGPLITKEDGKAYPCPLRKGLTFRRWRRKLEKLGYVVEMRELKACDYGAPTIRKRLFIIARCDGLPIVWPAPSHGVGLQPYRTAAECIDWSIPCPSIFERKRPLAEATLRRIAKGIKRFVLQAVRPFIVPVTHAGDTRTHSIDEPLRTITTAQRGELALIAPHVTKFRANSVGSACDEPLHTVTAGGECQRPAGAAHAMGVVAATLIGAGGPAYSGKPVSIEKPMGSMTTENHRALVAPFLVPRYGERPATDTAPAQEPRTHAVDAPLPTITPDANCGRLVAPVIVKNNFGDKPCHGADEPLHTVTTQGNKHALVAAFLEQANTGMTGHDARKPLSTIVQKGCTQRLITSNLVKLYGTCEHGQEVSQPMPTVTGGGNHIAEVRAFLIKYYGTAVGQDLFDPMHTVTEKHRLGLVTVDGDEYQIVDIGMRMLEPRELFRAQGFPDSYIITPIVDGRPLPKSSQVRMCGNSVSPVHPRSMVLANLVGDVSARGAAA
jgi:DNA (cytosine-5)-methyltransferase 1